MTRWKTMQVVWIVALCGVAVAPAAPQRDTEMVHRQRHAAERFAKLTAKMDEAADLLAGTDPASAAAIRQAARTARAGFVAADMAEVARLLSAGRWAGAGKRQHEVLSELRRMLGALQGGGAELADRLAQVRRWRAMLDDLDAIIAQQQSHHARASETADAGQRAESLAAAAERIERLAADQRELLAETDRLDEPGTRAEAMTDLRDRIGQLSAEVAALAEATRAIAVSHLPAVEKLQREQFERAESLEADLAGLAMPNAADAVRQANERMRASLKAVASGDKSSAADAQQRAADALAEADAAIANELTAMAEGTGYGLLADRQGELAASAGGLAGATATQAMTEAGGALGEMAKSEALKAQREAVQALAQAGRQAADETRKAVDCAKRPEYDTQARNQNVTADKADRLAADMARTDAETTTPAPGEAGVDTAREKMRQAVDRLNRRDADAARQAQGKALEQLARSRSALADAIRQASDQIQNEIIAQIEQKIRSMAEAQEAINADVARFWTDHGDNRGRAELIELRSLADRQGAQADEAHKAIEMLDLDGSSAVFPAVLADVRRQMTAAGELLAADQAGPVTQALGGEIAATLRDLLATLASESAADGETDDEAGGDESDSGPIVSMLAELKMLRLMQDRIHRETAECDAVGGDAEPLSIRQRKIRYMLLELRKKAAVSRGEGGQ